MFFCGCSRPKLIYCFECRALESELLTKLVCADLELFSDKAELQAQLGLQLLVQAS
jgi:hypothetical protein